jgi:alcohol dehydrogenase (NADP+)
VNCLFVGAGAAAEAYAAGLNDTPLSVTGVCDLDPERADAVAETLDAVAYTDLDAMLAADPAPLVVVLTSHAAHAPVVESALAADRHVFCQKPLALAPDRARELVALARDRDRALGCAPVAPRHPAQRRAGRLLADGRLGAVQLAYAHAHVGRVTEWHDDPESFLDVGPLYDGGVYPLTLLTAWFGPVARVRTADADTPWPARDSAEPSAPTHIEATLSFVDGPLVRLTASLYAPHRSREFNSLELHGDDGSLYLGDCGAGADGVETVQFGRQGREYTAVPPASHAPDGDFADGPARLARLIERVEARDGRPDGGGGHDRTTAVRAAHVVAVCDAIERAAERGNAVSVPEPSDPAVVRDRPTPPPFGRGTHAALVGSDDRVAGPASRRLPLVGVDVAGGPAATAHAAVDADADTDAVADTAANADADMVANADADTVANADAHTVAAALDAGCRLLARVDTETVDAVADALTAPGAPDRETIHVSARVAAPRDAVRLHDRLDGLDSLVFGGEPETWTDTVATVDAAWDGPLPALGLADATAERIDRLTATDYPPTLAVTAGEPEPALHETCREHGVRLLVAVPTSGDGDRVDHERAAVAAHVAAGRVPLSAAREPERLVAALAGGHDARESARGVEP